MPLIALKCRIRCQRTTRFTGRIAKSDILTTGDGNAAGYLASGNIDSLFVIHDFGKAFVSFGYGRANNRYRITDRWMEGTGNGWWAGLGAGLAFDNGLYLQGNLSQGTMNSAYDRIAFGYSLDGEFVSHPVSGDFASDLTNVGVELGWRGLVAPQTRLHLFAGANRVKSRRHGFDESDSTWGNAYGRDTVSDVLASAGVSLSHVLPLSGSKWVETTVSLSRSQQTSVGNRVITARSLAANGSRFTWDTIGATPNYAVNELGIGLKLHNASAVQWSVDFSGARNDVGKTLARTEFALSWEF